MALLPTRKERTPSWRSLFVWHLHPQFLSREAPDLRVLFLYGRPVGLGGIEAHMGDLLRALNRYGISVIVAAPRIARADILGPIPPQSLLIAEDTTKLVRILKHHGVGLIHAHSYAAATSGEQLMHITGCPLVITCHGPNMRSPQSALRRAAARIAVSPEVLDRLGLALQGGVVIENGVDLGRFYPTDHATFQARTVAYIGRIGVLKRRSLEALAGTCRRLGFRLLVVGDWAPPGAIHVPPTYSVDPYMRSAFAVFGTGRTVREAMACGVPTFVLGEFYDGPVTPQTISTLAYSNFSGRTRRLPPINQQLEADLSALLSRIEYDRRVRFGVDYATRFWDLRVVAFHTALLYRSVVTEVS